jgi:hypothetical protein
MEPRDENEIDDTAYFRTLREQEEGPWKARYGGCVKWDIAPEVEHTEDGHWRARALVMKMPGIREYTLDVPGSFDTEGAANRAAVDWATDWIALQPVE